MPITSQQARAELARRELARRESAQPTAPQTRTQRVEQEISRKSSAIRGLTEDSPIQAVRSIFPGGLRELTGMERTSGVLDPFGSITKSLTDLPTKTFLAGREAALGVPSSAALALQQGRPQDIGRDIASTLRGERPVGFGSVMRQAGVENFPGAGLARFFGENPEAVVGAAGLVKGAVRQVPKIAGVGARGVGRMFESAAQSAKAIPTALSETKTANLGQKVTQAFMGSKKVAGIDFADDVEKLVAANPGVTVNLRQTADEMVNLAKTSPKLVSDLSSAAKRSGNKTLQNILANPGLADNMTLAESQEVIRTLAKTPALQSKFGKFAPQWTDTDADLIELYGRIREAQLSSFPQFKDTLANYSDTLNKFRQVKRMFSDTSVMNSIRNNFGNEGVRKLINDLLPKEILRDIKAFQGAEKISRGGRKAAATAATGGLLAAGGKTAYDILSGK